MWKHITGHARHFRHERSGRRLTMKHTGDANADEAPVLIAGGGLVGLSAAHSSRTREFAPWPSSA